MVLILRPSRVVTAVLNACRPAVGGCIFADAPNVVISAAVIIRQVSTRQSTIQPQVTRLSRVSRPASGGSMIIERAISLPVRTYPRRIRTHWINRCPDPPDGYLQTGKRCSTNRKSRGIGQLLRCPPHLFGPRRGGCHVEGWRAHRICAWKETRNAAAG
jgi:hypothetical protein